MDRLKTICAQMTKATNEFRRCITEVRDVYGRQIDRLQRERDTALMAARVHTEVDDPNNMHHIPGVEIQSTKKVGLSLLSHTHARTPTHFIHYEILHNSICSFFLFIVP